MANLRTLNSKDELLVLAEGMALFTCIARQVPEALGSEREKLLEEFARLCAKHEAATTNRLTAHVTDVEKSVQASKPPEQKPKFDLSMIAVLGVVISGVVAALTSLVGSLTGAFVFMGRWAPFGVLGIFLAISTPSMILAALKLRQRNLAPLLDANGWAVNAKAKIGLWFGRRLTSVAKRPRPQIPGTRNSSR